MDWPKGVDNQQAVSPNRLLSGHDPFNYHRHILGEVEDPECRLCLEDDESSLHLLDECPALGQRRFKVLGYIQPRSGQKTRCLPALTRFINIVWETVNGTQSNFAYA